MSTFDPATVIATARLAAPPAGWQIRRLQRGAVLWDLGVRLGVAVVLLTVCGLLIAGAQPRGGDGAVPYVFAAFALAAGLAYLAAAWAPLQQLRHPDAYLLVLAPEGIALDWSGRALGLPYTRLADASLRRRSFRALFGQDLILAQADGSELLLPLGDLFGEPADILPAVIADARRARGLPPVAPA